MKMRSAQIIFLAATMVLAQGCTKSTDDLIKWVADEKAKPAPPPDPLPVLMAFPTFKYDADSFRDPFIFGDKKEDDSVAVGGTGIRPPADHTPQELEAFPLDSLDMAGTMGIGAAIQGLIKEPDGTIVPVNVGDYIGQNYGRITEITKDHISLIEIAPNGNDGWEERQASISLDDKN
jgi:type IV pilus assembly protein PilP